ncbi:uncharacterized protein [Branchiostoma lanceolatum]|uniref:uncharacterized protein n=1 Tax=Branchiostoma lanceolatum TaxID=7740 RepID=UPI003453A97B
MCSDIAVAAVMMWDSKVPEWLGSSDTVVRHRPLSEEDSKEVSCLLDNPPCGWPTNAIETLRDGEWLSDYVIDKYMSLIKKSCITENDKLKVEIFDCTAYQQLRTRTDFLSYKKRLKTPKVMT